MKKNAQDISRYKVTGGHLRTLRDSGCLVYPRLHRLRYLRVVPRRAFFGCQGADAYGIGTGAAREVDSTRPDDGSARRPPSARAERRAAKLNCLLAWRKSFHSEHCKQLQP